MNSRRLRSLALSLVNVAAGGALVAVAAYATDHSSEQPALYAALLLVVREIDKWRNERDPTRGAEAPPSS